MKTDIPGTELACGTVLRSVDFANAKAIIEIPNNKEAWRHEFRRIDINGLDLDIDFMRDRLQAMLADAITRVSLKRQGKYKVSKSLVTHLEAQLARV
jgi:hypothetical protein